MAPVHQLAEIPFFQNEEPWVLERLAEAADEVSLAANVLVLQQHNDAQHVFFLLSGAVQLLLRFEGVDDLLVGTRRDFGEIFGWSAFRAPYRYTASVRCEESCRFIRIPRTAFERVFAQDPRCGYRMLQRVAAAVALRLEEARDWLMMTSEQMSPEGASHE